MPFRESLSTLRVVRGRYAGSSQQQRGARFLLFEEFRRCDPRQARLLFANVAPWSV